MKVYILLLISIILFSSVINYGIYLVKNNYIQFIRENFQNNTNHSNTVNLPINTKYSCQNMCGPQARCSITGQQCTSDIDCFGCKKIKHHNYKKPTSDVLGINEAGKLTTSFTPTYSSLTTDIGTQSKLYADKNTKPPEYFKGVNQWSDEFYFGNKLFDKIYNTNIETLPFLPRYPTRQTLSGEFVDNGPLASNAFL
jgi:hypothetical protein